MIYKKPILRQFIIAVIMWIVLSVFYIMGINVLFITAIDSIKIEYVKVINIIFGALCVVTGFITNGLFTIRSIDDYLEDKGEFELTGIKSIIETLIINQQKIRQIDINSYAQKEKQQYSTKGEL